MNGSYDCERKWISPKGNSYARSALRDILGGGEMRQPAQDVERMRPQDFRDEYNGEEWWFDYVLMKRKFMEKSTFRNIIMNALGVTVFNQIF
jgi:hypothetical protein